MRDTLQISFFVPHFLHQFHQHQNTISKDTVHVYTKLKLLTLDGSSYRSTVVEGKKFHGKLLLLAEAKHSTKSPVKSLLMRRR